MKKSMKRLVSMVMALCMCAMLVPGVLAASVPTAEKMIMSIGLTACSDDTYDVTYTAKLTITEQFSKIVALNKGDTAMLKELRFTCVLKDNLVKMITEPTKSDFTFTGPGAGNFDFISVAKKNSDEIHIVYKLNEAKVDSWKTMKAADVQAALKQEMMMKSTKNVAETKIIAAEKDGMLTTVGEVRITDVNGKIPYFEEKEILAAKGTAVARRSYADPAETGVADWLITGDHIAYMQGYDTGLFQPNANITRAETAQMFYNLLKNKNVTITTKFDDVAETAWYHTAVNTLASLTKLEGVGNNKFEPGRAITRAEFATLAARFAKAVDSDIAFDDVPDGHWAEPGVITAAMYGWVKGVGDMQFEPNRPITRAEAATIVNHMLCRMADKAAVDAGEARQFPDVAKNHWAYYEIAEAVTAHDFELNKDRTVETWK